MFIFWEAICQISHKLLVFMDKTFDCILAYIPDALWDMHKLSIGMQFDPEMYYNLACNSGALHCGKTGYLFCAQTIFIRWMPTLLSLSFLLNLWYFALTVSVQTPQTASRKKKNRDVLRQTTECFFHTCMSQHVVIAVMVFLHTWFLSNQDNDRKQGHSLLAGTTKWCRIYTCCQYCSFPTHLGCFLKPQNWGKCGVLNFCH